MLEGLLILSRSSFFSFSSGRLGLPLCHYNNLADQVSYLWHCFSNTGVEAWEDSVHSNPRGPGFAGTTELAVRSCTPQAPWSPDFGWHCRPGVRDNDQAMKRVCVWMHGWIFRLGLYWMVAARMFHVHRCGKFLVAVIAKHLSTTETPMADAPPLQGPQKPP